MTLAIGRLPMAMRHGPPPPPLRPGALAALLALAVVLIAWMAQAESPVLHALGSVRTAAGVAVSDGQRLALAQAVEAVEDVGELAAALRGDALDARLWLAAVAVEESGLRADVAACATRGDGGRSWGWWQVHRPSSDERAAMCVGGAAGLAAQARAGLARATQCARGGAWGARGLAACYVGEDAAGARARADRYALLRRAGGR